MRQGPDEGERRRPLTLRHPRATVVSALLLIICLGIVGWGVESKLKPTSLSVPGSPSAIAGDLLDRHFGASAPFVVMLRGHRPALDRQGPKLVGKLRDVPGATTLSPWDEGNVARLRPGPDRALILVDFHVDSDRAVRDAVPQLNRILARATNPPIVAKQTGFATLSRAIQDESVRSTQIAELIAAPFLLLVLLFVFGSPLAAAVPLCFGIASVVIARGLLALGASSLEIDGFALTVATMMGLALGIDYALLMVSRFREELDAGVGRIDAALSTRRTAGRTTAFAGSTLILAMAVTFLAMPGSLFLSLAGTAILVTLISVAVAFTLAPPLLYLLGPNIDRGRIGSAERGSWLVSLLDSTLQRPQLSAAAVFLSLFLLALPALALKTGPPGVSQLPTSNAARQDAEEIDRAIGAGWDAPFVMVAASDRDPITSSARLTDLARLQHAIAADPGVQAVVGPAQVQRRVRPLKRGGNEVLVGKGEASPARLARLGRKLGDAAGGVGQIRGGLSTAATGAALLATGSGRAGDGADQIAEGISHAADGATRAVGALDRLKDGSGQIVGGQRRAALGSRAVRDELSSLLPILRRGGLARARSLRRQLLAAAATEPALGPAAVEAEHLVEALGLARNQARRARVLAIRLHSGQERLADAGKRLHEGVGALADGARPLPEGLRQLGVGTSQLAAGLERLTDGADALSANLDRGSGEARPLQRRLSLAGVSVSASASRASNRVDALRRSSPGIFNSSYFVLSALDGAPEDSRRLAGETIDLADGSAAQLLIVPRYTFNTPGSKALNRRLNARADAFANSTGLDAGVTGGPAQLVDYDNTIASRIPLVVAAITLVTFLVLVLVLRAVPLAAIAVALNLLTVAAAFGVLTLLFDVPAGWPLGGHSYVDAIGAAGIFGIVFGLSIDYAVFLLTRMRERHREGASNAEAIRYGLERTARVITGAAAIMVAVFVAFAAAPIATVSQLGTGLTVAVLLDATVVRIVLLPALMLLVGERVWWMPAIVERVLSRAKPQPS